MISSSAARSLSHRGDQTAANFAHSTCSIGAEMLTPRSMLVLTPAPMAAAITAINKNLPMPAGAAKTLRPPAHQLTRTPPANAWNASLAAAAAVA